PYAGKTLESGKAYYWRVRAWDSRGNPGNWSPTASFSTGLLRPEEWKGEWIGLDGIDTAYHLTGTNWIWFPEGSPEKSAPVGTRYFRRVVEIPTANTVASARLHITGDNECTVFVNGVEIHRSDDLRMVPDLDLIKRLHPGSNLIAVSVRNVGGGPNPAGLIGLLEIRHTDGTVTSVPTDASWKAAGNELPGWEQASFDDRNWVSAKVLGPAGMQPWGEMYGPEDRRLPARYLRKVFEVQKKIRRATAYICGLGLSELSINGRKVGNDVLSPALSQYTKRVYYVTHDVTDFLSPGTNAIGVALGNGRFFAPRLSQPTFTQSFGFPKLLFQLHIEFDDGTSSDVASDGSWKLTAAGPIRANNEYDGEEYDARMELPGWDSQGYDDSGWEHAHVVASPGGAVRAQMIDPIRVTGTLKPVSIKELRPGVFIVDMGQNMVGWCRISVNGPRGTSVTLRHAETLKEDGSLYLDNIRGAKVTDVYTLKGGGPETYEPRFTYHGFRFVEVTGFPGVPGPDAIEGRVVNDDVKTAGEFACSNAVINRIYRNIVWGVRGNYRSMPTDCPQRDERQGWLGDRSAESRGETYLFGINALYAKWLQDMEDAQREDGSVSDVCPSYWPLYNDNVTWPSSTVIIPGALHDQYADAEIIRRHYPSMVKWIDHMSGYIADDVITKDNYGDWCVPPEDPKLIHSNDPMRKTAPGILATSYFYHDLRLMARYAAMLSKEGDAKRFSAMAERMLHGLNASYYNVDRGYYDNGSQTSCVLPLAFGMVPAPERGKVFDHLTEKITRETNWHIGTGLVGGQWLSRVLSDNGRADIVYRFATDTTYPGWGYMASRGATTVWELWNGDSADPGMNSGNHVMLVGDFVIWLYEYVAGIRPDPALPGFKHILMRPLPVGDLTFARGTHASPYGLIASEWKKGKDSFEWTITIPPNSTATVSVPARSAQDVLLDGKPPRESGGVSFVRQEQGYAVFDIGSGTYTFVSKGI
ncbi:MAG TPA: family 78 glycoside hydrolase catalytic domain, partial [Bacteroidota bacterium]|nr:family 78 glycoside hydrolase catalytic domain [Bacteroidota bacterium]